MTFYDLLSGPKGLAAGLRAFFALHSRPAWWASDHGNYFENKPAEPSPTGFSARTLPQNGDFVSHTPRTAPPETGTAPPQPEVGEGTGGGASETPTFDPLCGPKAFRLVSIEALGPSSRCISVPRSVRERTSGLLLQPSRLVPPCPAI